MTEYRFDTEEFYSSEEFHVDREAADHLHEDGHGARIRTVAGLVNALFQEIGTEKSLIDYGCGNGGLLSLLEGDDLLGLDFCRANVNQAVELGRPVVFSNFVETSYRSDVAVLSEVLEHMVDPHGFLKDLQTTYLVASVPNGETPDSHYPYHLWGWDVEGFQKVLEGAGYEVMLGGVFEGTESTQMWVAEKVEL